MNDPYLYRDCSVLKNKLGVKDGDLLSKAEVEFSCNAIHQMLTNPIKGVYDFSHLCDMHHAILGDIYEWAGKPRAIMIEKEEAILGGMSIEYSRPKDIERSATSILSRMNDIRWNRLKLEEQAVEISVGMAELWKVHPFREGNTRTVVTFFCEFARSKEVILDREIFEKHPVYMRNALVAASAVFSDGCDFRKTEYLLKIIKDSLELGLAQYNKRITKDINESGFQATDKVIDKMKRLHQAAGKELKVNEVHGLLQSGTDKELILLAKSVGVEFASQERLRLPPIPEQ